MRADMLAFAVWLIFIICIVASTGCTENELAKNFGGTMHVELPCDQKLYDITWKDLSLWYATKPFTALDVPETYTYREASEYGVMEGTVVIKEIRCTRGGVKLDASH